MQKFKVTGMSCAACSARVEKAVQGVENAENVSINLITGDLSVNGSADKEAIKKAVISAGYGITDYDENAMLQEEEKDKKPIIRLIFSLAILLVLMYFSLFHELFSFPLPYFFKNTFNRGIFELLLTLLVFIINRRFFINGVKGVIHLSPNMDTLVSLGAAASFFYSLYSVICLYLNINTGKNYFYFESAAMILTFISVGKALEEKAKHRSVNAVNSLKKMRADYATAIINGKETVVLSEELKVDDVFIVRPGESIPADGVVIEGSASADESAITGESIPVFKTAGSPVTGGTVNRNGFLKCRVTATVNEGIFSKIIETVADATATKAPIARLADKVAGIFVPAVLLIALITFIIWMIIGASLGKALSFAVSVLVISCPCALGLATPVAITVASGVAAKCGILFKNAEAIELCGKIKTVILDKTGTVTTGAPSVCEVFADDKNQLLSVAYSLEKLSSHPLSIAVCDYAESLNIKPVDVSEFKEISGEGITAKIEGGECFGVSVKSAESKIELNGKTREFIKKTEEKGQTPLVFIKNDALLGIITVSDTVKADSVFAINLIKKSGIKVIMLTGDNETTAKAIAKDVNINDVIAEVMPNDKAEIIKKYQKISPVAMVGDGINDAPALAVADVGFAVGGSKDIASKTANAVLLSGSLSGVASALMLGRKTLSNIKENLFWAFFYNLLGIPLASGVFYSLFGFTISPMVCALAMSLSSFCVVSNALRLNLFKAYKTEEKSMKKTVFITGMMCPHCEAHVKAALEAIEGVMTADVSHEKGEAVITLSAEVENEKIISAIKTAGYTVTEIK